MNMNDKPLSVTQLEQFQRDGYIILRSLFDAEEIELLGRAAKDDRILDQNSFGRNDGSGGNIRLSLWSDPGDNLYGMYARCPRIVGAMEQILGGPVGHYHSKMIMKDAKVGGAWEWHQDYGYWYDIGYLSPDLASVMIAVDKATKENGCLQVIKGSHRLGRINHTETGQQAGADLTRVREVLDKLAAVQMLDVHFPTTDGRILILSRYTELNADQKLLINQLRLSLPPQPPPRITAAGQLASAHRKM